MVHSMIKRLGRPGDIASCATYVSSDESTRLTAADICIDGGTT